MRLWGSLITLRVLSSHAWIAAAPGESRPIPKVVCHGSFAAIYVQLLEKTRSKSCILPWEQKWWAGGGVNSPALSHLWDIPISGSFPLAWKGPLCRVTDSGRIYCFFPWWSSGRDQSNQHPVLPRYYRSSGHCAEKTSPFPVSVFSDVQNYS